MPINLLLEQFSIKFIVVKMPINNNMHLKRNRTYYNMSAIIYTKKKNIGQQFADCLGATFFQAVFFTIKKKKTYKIK